MWWRVVVVVVGCLAALTAACSCPRRHPQQHYCEADFVVAVKVRRVITLPDAQEVLKVQIRRLFKSSPRATSALKSRLIYTVPGTCSLNVTGRALHVITGDVQAGKPWTSACHLAAPWKTLAPKMKKGFRLLYRTGCDCPIMSCHWWESRCPSASFFCSWRTSTQTEDCQARHGVCLRNPSGECKWLGGRSYRRCMKAWRADFPANPDRGHVSNVASLVPSSGDATSASDAITSNDVVDGVKEDYTGVSEGRDGLGRRKIPPLSTGLGVDTTYSFGPRVSSSRFHKPRKLKPIPHINSIYHTGRKKPIKINSRRGMASMEGSYNRNHYNGAAGPSGDQSSLLDGDKRPSTNRIPDDRVWSSSDERIAFVPSGHEHENEPGGVSPGVELAEDFDNNMEFASAYHRRRYPEYSTRIGYIPDN